MQPHQQAALQAAMMNPAALSAIIQSQNPQLLHQIQHQQLQQLQQLHQQNLRLAAAFNQNQMGKFFSSVYFEELGEKLNMTILLVISRRLPVYYLDVIIS